MFESFLVNIVSSIAYDVAKKVLGDEGSSARVKEFQTAYMAAFATAGQLYAKDHDQDETNNLLKSINVLTNVPNVRGILLEIASDELDASASYLQGICDQHDINFNVIRSFLELFLGILRQDLRARAENPESSLFRSIVLFDHVRFEYKIDQVREDIQTLTGVVTKKAEQEFISFEKEYRKHLTRRHENIIPPNSQLDRHPVPLERLYVSPHITEVNRDKPKTLNLVAFQLSIHRTVVLASPGGGKSTLAEKLCLDLSKNPLLELPILVTVRDYAKTDRSISEFVEEREKNSHRIKPPKGSFEYFFKRGRVLMIFDGLDELLDTSDRLRITSIIEIFCEEYPLVSVLVTSREVGYWQAPLKKQIFSVYRISDFDTGQIREYAEKWFSLNTSIAQDTREVKAFLAELPYVPNDIKCNPLLLALICTIYRGQGYIPHERPEIYENCANLLFSRRDNERKIKYDLPFEAHLRPTMSSLAYWIYGNQTLESGVTEKLLVIKATEYLEKQLDNQDQAEYVARQFVSFCTGRAWVFSDTGTTKEGVRLYQFTHRTFLEYFTAQFLLRKYRTPQALLRFIESKISKGIWTVVTELAFQQMARDVEGAKDKLLLSLIERSKENPADSLNILNFAIRCLSFFVPKTRTVIALFETCITLGIELCAESIELYGDKYSYQKNNLRGDHFITGVLASILNLSNENFTIVFDHFAKLFIPLILAGDGYRELIATEVALNISKRNSQAAKIHVTKEVEENIINICFDHIHSLSVKYEVIAHDLYKRGKINLAEFIRAHGIAVIFRTRYYLVYSYVSSTSPMEQLMTSLLDNRLSESEKLDLEEIGNVLLKYSLPWIDLDGFSYDLDAIPKSAFSLILNSEALFGVFCLLAFVHEMLYESKGHRVSLAEYNAEIFVHESIVWAFVLRFYQEDHDELWQALDEIDFKPEKREFIEKWARGEINVI